MNRSTSLARTVVPPRRRARLLLPLIAAVLAWPTASGAAAEACRSKVLAQFERELPAETRRYAVGAELALPFAELWDRARPSGLTILPDAVTVYERRDQPVLVAYRVGGCVLAVVAVERDRFRRVLRDGLGEVA